MITIKQVTIGIVMVVMFLMTIIGATAFVDVPEYYWDCEGNLDNTGIQTGYSLNNTGVTFTPSPLGQACSFGINDFATNSSMGNLTTTFTISMWVNASALSNDQVMLEISDGSDFGRLAVNWDNGNNQYVTGLRRNGNSQWELVGGTNFVQNAYAHVVVMQNSSGTFQFHNGTLVVGQTANNIWFGDNIYPILRLGGDASVGLTFAGDIEQLALFNRSFNTDDVIFDFNNGVPLNYIMPPENFTLSSPSDGSTRTSPVNFSFTVGAGIYTTATLYHNDSGFFKANETINSPNTTFLNIPLNNGSILWNVEVNFTAGGGTFAEDNFTVNIVAIPIPIFETFECPVEDIPQSLIFITLVVLAAFIIVIGFAFGSPLIGTFGGFMLILLGFVIVGCQQSLGMLTSVAGVFIIVKFLFGTNSISEGRTF